MRMIKKLVLLMVVVLFSISAASDADTPQEKYIKKYAPIAVSEMYRTGVPASITLAQGLLESRYGQSTLAVSGNNHFGIKCHDWTGKKQYADDDKKGECFRVYESAEASFYDHSDFLRYRDRYKFLFENETTDYKAWAYGLKKAGYATDPAYPTKLIKLIEDYELHKYDKMTAVQADAVSESETSVTEKTKKRRVVAKAKKVRKANRRNMTARQEETNASTQIPDSPLSLEQPKKYEVKASESYTFSLSRQMYSLNGVPFIYVTEGETISSIASSNNLFVKELLRFNDMKTGQEPEIGSIIYLQAKKKSTARGLDKYIADEGGESLWDISQRFGVKLSELCKKNSLTEDYILKEGDTIILR